jgi:lipase chaperone LimK
MSRRSLGRVLLAGSILLLLLLLTKSFKQTEAISDSSRMPTSASRQDSLINTQKASGARQPEDKSMPRLAPHPSLVGTDVNGGIRVGRDGQIILHRDLRRLFDYYLSLLGRMDAQAIRALLEQNLNASESSAVTEQALAIYDKYLKLIDAETKLAERWTERDLTTTATVARVVEERRHLRREHLGDELTEAFFEDQENYEAYQLERLKIGTNPNLTESEKAEALTAAENLLAPEQREIRKRTFAWLDIKKIARQPVESLDAEGAEAIAQRFGENALKRLAAVEEERKTWEQKREAWLLEKARLAARTDLSEAEKSASLLEFAKAYLDAGELRRMQALDSDTLPTIPAN